MKGIYIHIPFCKQLCSYCDFYFSVSLSRKHDMLQALMREMELRRHYFLTPTGQSATLYFGGGTPSIYAPEELALLIQKAKYVFEIESFTEVTLEANPDDLSPEILQNLLAIGITRLSIGIQSFQESHLQWMRRRHTAAQAIESVKQAQRSGFENITIDLMYGLPQLSMEEWESTLIQALKLKVPHISAYHLTIEPRTIIGKQAGKGLLQPLREEESERQFLQLHYQLTQAGYQHYEVSNFALPGYRALHNSAYWQRQPYIGIGPSAHSFDGLSRQWNKASNKQYLEALAQGIPFSESEILTIPDCYNEYIMTGLRMSEGIAPAYIQQHFGGHYANYFLQHSKPYLQTGKLVRQNNGRINIPAQHFFVSDAIIASLFWPV